MKHQNQLQIAAAAAARSLGKKDNKKDGGNTPSREFPFGQNPAPAPLGGFGSQKSSTQN